MDAFVMAATDRRWTQAERLLSARPEIANDPWAALVLGRGWDGDPNEPGGPLNWAPILYVSHSCFASSVLARELLGRGADPDATFTNEYGEMSALYGVAGVVHDSELTRVLLEAGANPDDGESLYHSVEHESSDCVRLLLEHGATVDISNALGHSLDYEDSSRSASFSTRAGAPPRVHTSHTRFAAGAARMRFACWSNPVVTWTPRVARRGGETCPCARRISTP